MKINETKKEKNREIYENKQKHKKEYKNLSKEEKEKIANKKRLENEFNYIEDLIKCDEMLQSLEQKKLAGKLVYVDPGQKSIGMFMGTKKDDTGNESKVYFNYTSKQRIAETKRKEYNERILHEKRNIIINDKKLTRVESELPNKKTINEKIFLEYTKKKLEVRSVLKNEENYHNCLQKLNWYLFLNKRKHEKKLLNKLADVFGKDATMIVGDWNNRGKLKHISTPGIGFKRMLKKQFEVDQINEHKTSMISSKTFGKTKNLIIEKNKKLTRLHSVLTYKMSDRRTGCIQRDKNAVNNYETIVTSLIKTGERPIVFRRNCANPDKVQKDKIQKSASIVSMPITNKNSTTGANRRTTEKSKNENKKIVTSVIQKKTLVTKNGIKKRVYVVN